MLYLEIDSLEAPRFFAAEHYLLHESGIGEPVFMLWSTKPTLMLGRFQNIASEINTKYAKEKGIALTRRASGGGTIYTDPGGFQYTYFLPAGTGGPLSFRENSAAVVRALNALGVPAVFNERNDILVGGRKVSGTARYAARAGVIHHGSLLYDTDLSEMVRSITVDDEKLVAKGIKSIRQRVSNIAEHMPEKLAPLEFRAALLQEILGGQRRELTLTEAQEARVLEIKRGIFDNWDWTWGENPAFSATKARRFPGGKVEISFDSKNGVIERCRLNGDFFFEGDIRLLEQSLAGCPLSERALTERLEASGQLDRFFMITAREIVSLILEN